MHTRKSSLIVAVLAGLLLNHLALAGAYPLWAAYVDGPKLTIVNNSGRPASQIYLVFLARPYSETLAYNTHRIKWEDKTFPRIDPIDDTVTFGAYSYANYSTTLDKLSQDPVTGNHYFFLPKKENEAVPNDKAGFDSGRLWISFKTPCYFRVFIDLPPPDGTGHLTYSSPTFMNPSNPNANTVFDFFEPQLSVTGDICTVHADTSNVESVAMPLLYQLYNNETLVNDKTKGLNRPLRELRRAFLADPVFKGLVTPVGVMAPGHGIELGKLSATYYKNYVDYCWQHWTDNPLDFEYPLGTGTAWTGGVVGDVLTLTGPQTVSISRPPSKDIFFCNGVFNGPDEVDKAIKNQVASALNRTVMHLAPYPTGTKTQYPWESYKPPTGYVKDDQTFMFYQQNGLTSGNYQTNVYSKILHQLSYDGTIYGFPYDDNADQSSFIDGVATEIKLTIGNSQLSTPAPILGLLLD